MKAARNIAESIANNPEQLPSTRPPTAAPLGTVDADTARVIDLVFMQLMAIFPAWKQAWPTDKALATAKRSWTKGLMAAGINTVEQVRFGIEQCRASTSPFVPSNGQFVQWCRPTAESLGLPSDDKAFAEAVRKAHPGAQDQKWSHPVVLHAAKATGFHNLAALSAAKSRAIFDRNYVIACRMAVEGRLQPIPPALTDGVPSRVTPDAGREGISALRQAMKAPPLTELPEHMAHLKGGL